MWVSDWDDFTVIKKQKIKAMAKIEAVTCIKFEDRNRNNHKELGF